MTRLRFAIPVIVAACGGSDNKPCDVAAQTGCGDGDVCEDVAGGMPACFAPVEIHGRVLALADMSGIAGARVVALDVNGAAVTNVAISATDGTYKLTVPTVRNADGTANAFPTVTLHADAEAFQSFPGPVREALPLDLSMAMQNGDGYVLQSALTDIGLIRGTTTELGSIEGTAEVPPDHAGVLVVAELNGVGFTAIAARNGDYKILNLAPGHYTVTAYSVGHV